MMKNKTLLLRLEGSTDLEWELEANAEGQTTYPFGRTDDGSGSKVIIDYEYLSRVQGSFIYSDGLWKYQDTGSNKPKLISHTGHDRSNILAQGSPVVIFSGDTLRFGKDGELVLRIATKEN